MANVRRDSTMNDDNKTRAELIEELQDMRRRLADLDQMKQHLHRSNLELNVLCRTSQHIVSSLEFDTIVTNLLEAACDLMNAKAGSLWLMDTRSNELVCGKAAGPFREIVEGWRLPPVQGIAGWVFVNRTSLNVPDTRLEPRHFNGVSKEVGWEVRSLVAVPLYTKEDTLGVLEIVDHRTDHFRHSDMRILESLAALATIAIENARLYERTRHDAETKSRLLKEINHRIKNSLSVIIGLLGIEQAHAERADPSTFQQIIGNLSQRIQGVVSVYDLLSDSGWLPVKLDELTRRIIQQVIRTSVVEKRVRLQISPSPVLVSPRQAHKLALLINELITNTIKHALVQNESTSVDVDIFQKNGKISLQFKDDGPGYSDNVLIKEKYNIGLDLIQIIARMDLEGDVALQNNDGAVTTIRFPVEMHY